MGVFLYPGYDSEPGKFHVGFVDYYCGMRCSLYDLFKFGVTKQCSRWIIRVRNKKHTGSFLQRAYRLFCREFHLCAVPQVIDSRATNLRVVAVHRKCRFREQNTALRINECIEEHT